MIKLIIVVLLLICRSYSAVFPAAGLTSPQIQAAINAAGDDDIVTLPAGFGILTNRIGITNRAIEIIGAGIGLTTLTDYTGNTNSFGTFTWRNTGGRISTMKGVTMIPSLDATRRAQMFFNVGQASQSSTQRCYVRFTEIEITDIYIRGIAYSGYSYGLVDNCILRCQQNVAAQALTVFGPNFNWPTNQEVGSPWSLPNLIGADLGTNTVVMEDCIGDFDFENDAFVEVYNGGRVTIRYTSLTNSIILGIHGTDSTTRGGMWFEVYNSDLFITDSAASVSTPLEVRSGSGYVNNFNIHFSPGVDTNAIALTLKLYRATATNIYQEFNATTNQTLVPTNSVYDVSGNLVVPLTYTGFATNENQHYWYQPLSTNDLSLINGSQTYTQETVFYAETNFVTLTGTANSNSLVRLRWTRHGYIYGQDIATISSPTNRIDGNSNSVGWPALDQPGRVGPTVFTGTRSTQPLFPMLLWSNYWIANGITNNFSAIDAFYFYTNIYGWPITTNFLRRGIEWYDDGTEPSDLGITYVPLVYPHPWRGSISPPPETNNAVIMNVIGIARIGSIRSANN